MKILSKNSILLLSISTLIVSCDEDPIVNQLTNCEFATQVFINDDAPDLSIPDGDLRNSIDAENPPFLDEQEIQVCGRSAQELQDKLDQLAKDNEELTTTFNIQNPQDPDSMDPDESVDVIVNIPTGQPGTAMGGSTITFDEDIDFTFGDGLSASAFANSQSMINAKVTTGDEPAATPDAALQVEITPSTLNDAGDGDQGFYFAGTTFELDNLGVDLVDFTGTNKVITANVYSDVQVGFRVQVSSVSREDGSLQQTPAPGYKQFQHPGGGWSQISIDFSSGVSTVFGFPAEVGIQGGQNQTLPLDGNYNTLQFQFEGLAPDVLARIFVDNVVYNQEGGTDVVVVEPVLTPTALINFDDLSTGFTAFNGAVASIVDNPNLSGTNDTASQVLSIENTATLNFEGVASNPLDIDFGATSSKTITVDVFSDQQVAVELQVKRNEEGVTLEDPRGASLTQTHTGSGWETLTFNFNDGANKTFDGFADDGENPFIPEGLFNQFVILINPGTPAPLGAATYFVDNINILVAE